ncbi:hypothetical protein [Devosia alba]|uniref:hypothetical protein n=1 Tax=Devosia alba TaxID=3152360 RepID=UPI003263561A
MNSTRSISSEIGTALAVLAIYLLTLLAPLHEARASQLAFEKLGYSTLQSGWVLCSSLSTSDSDPDSETPVSKCPVTGVGKSALVGPALDAVVLDLGAIMLAAPRPVARVTVRPATIAPPSGPRGPPALV